MSASLAKRQGGSRRLLTYLLPRSPEIGGKKKLFMRKDLIVICMCAACRLTVGRKQNAWRAATHRVK